MPPRPRKPRPTRTRRPPRGAGEQALYGINPVEAALEAARRRLVHLHVKGGRPSERLARLRRLAEARGVAVSEGDPRELERLCGSPDHQGTVLRCGPLPVRGEGEALALADVVAGAEALAQGPLPLLLALDQVEDPRNFGAVVRACAVLGADGAVVPRHHTAPGSAAASKASAGLLERFPVYEAANLARFLGQARERGFWVAGTVVEGGTPLPAFRRERALIVVLGNEERGLRPLVQRQCDHLLTIPMANGCLNVSAAAAVVLYALGRAARDP